MPAKPRWNRETALLAWLAACISFLTFAYYFRAGEVLLYGDAVAHINIARRVFDSQTPGPLQLGTVWLPLPHLLIVPFIVSRWLWQTGIGGSIASLVTFVASVIGVFRLVRSALLSNNNFVKAGSPALSKTEGFSRVQINTATQDWTIRFTAWLAALILAFNPNLIYLQTTAMTEPIYLAASIWAIVFFVEAIRACTGGNPTRGNSSLIRCGFCLLAACFTRYDGWLLAMTLVILSVFLAWAGNFSALRRGGKKLAI